MHISYFTAHVDDTGKVDIRPDIYGIDSRVASALEGRRAQVGSVANGSKDKTKKRRSYSRKKNRKSRRRAEKKEPFNPLSSMQ